MLFFIIAAIVLIVIAFGIEIVLLFIGWALFTIVTLIVSGLCGEYASSLGRRLHYHRRAQQVTGTLLNVVRVNGELVSLYRYTLPTGAVLEAASFIPAASCEGGELYSQTTLLVFPDIPQVVCEKGRLFTGVLGGAVPLAMLCILIYQATTEGRFTFWTWLVIAAAVFVMGARYRSEIGLLRTGGPGRMN